jgi:YD repeat-containing protein
LNGNLRFQRSPDGTVLQAYQWDAKNRLVKILEGTQETEFAYDGKDRRVLKIERTHGSEISRTHYIWEGSNIVQSRAADASYSGFATFSANSFNPLDWRLGLLGEADGGLVTDVLGGSIKGAGFVSNADCPEELSGESVGCNIGVDVSGLGAEGELSIGRNKDGTLNGVWKAEGSLGLESSISPVDIGAGGGKSLGKSVSPREVWNSIF